MGTYLTIMVVCLILSSFFFRYGDGLLGHEHHEAEDAGREGQ